MDRRNAQGWRAVARWLALALLAPLTAYAVAGLIGGAIPANRNWRPPARGVTVFVETNGIHTGIVVPKVAAGVDWRPLARPEHLRDPRYAGFDHLSFGWGERTFYLETPTWWDVRPRTVLAAMFGSERTLVHLDHVPRPRPESAVRPIVLTDVQYRRLAAFLAASIAPGGERLPGYFGYDAFYAARGRYSGLRTCNEWTGAALRHAGVRVGAWTPFTATVMWWF